MKTRHAAALLLLALLAAAAFVPGTTATDMNKGTIKVHDSVNVEPPTRNQPHVPCDSIFIEGFMMADSAGTLEFTSWPPTGNMTVVLIANWTADSGDEAGEYHFLAGPFTLTQGHYRVEAFAATGHPGSEGHFAKAKMFWADCEPDELACPTDLAAVANPDGSVTLTFMPAAGSDGTNVYRLDADDDWELIATVDANATSYTDSGLEIGVTYTYTVTALFGDRESVDCPLVEVTTIPEFPTALAMGIAATCGILAYAVIRRKK